MPVTPEELRLIKEKMADVVIAFQQGTIDLPDSLAAIRDFDVPTEEVVPPATDPPVPDPVDPPTVGDGVPSPTDPPTGDEVPVPDEAALAQASAELDEALATALSRIHSQ